MIFYLIFFLIFFSAECAPRWARNRSGRPRRTKPDAQLLQRPSRLDRFVDTVEETVGKQDTGEDGKIPCCQRHPLFTPDDESQNVPCDELFNAHVINDPQSCNTFESGKECVWICDGAPVGITFDTDALDSEDVLTQNMNPYDEDYYSPRGGVNSRHYGGENYAQRYDPPRGGKKGRNGHRSGPDFYRNAKRYRNKRESAVNLKKFFNRGHKDRGNRSPGPIVKPRTVGRTNPYYDYNYFYDYGYNDYDYDDYFGWQEENKILRSKDNILQKENERLYIRVAKLEEKMGKLFTNIGKGEFEIQEEELQLEEEMADEDITLENKEKALDNLEKLFDEEEEILYDIEEEADYMDPEELKETEDEYLQEGGDTVTEIIYDLFKTKKTEEEKEAEEEAIINGKDPEIVEQLEEKKEVPDFEEKYDLQEIKQRQVSGKFFGDRKAEKGWFQDEEEVKEELAKELESTM